VRFEDKAGGKLLLWFGLFGADGAIEPQPLKAARDTSQKGEDAAVTFSDRKPVGGVPVPHRRRWVEGLDERAEREFVAASIRGLDAVPEAKLKPPVAAKE